MRILSGTHRVRPLAAALVSILTIPSFAGNVNAGDANTSTHSLSMPRASAVGLTPDASPSGLHNVLTVKNCQDDGADSLRALISAANEDDTIEFDMAQMQCSVITLSSVEIPIIRNNLTVRGPASGQPMITISGEGQHRVFNHVGTGLLLIGNLRIENGYAHGSGGCIWSDGSVSLTFSEVTDCTAVDSAQFSVGGGVGAKHDITLVRSTISGNRAGNAARPGHGGGVHSALGGALVWYSSISDNYASAQGGGLETSGANYVLGSTIDHNHSLFASALWLGSDTKIVNSTVSSNIAYDGGVAVFSRFGSLLVESSTITLNHDDASQPLGAVVLLGGLATDKLTFQSSIIAGNTNGPDDVATDVYSFPGQGVVFGAANLTGASNVWPPGVFIATTDPRLGPLQWNGGFTRTHALLPDSPARGIGNNNGAQTADQRGAGYPRITGAGPNATVDIGSVQFDSIFFGGFEFTN